MNFSLIRGETDGVSIASELLLVEVSCNCDHVHSADSERTVDNNR